MPELAPCLRCAQVAAKIPAVYRGFKHLVERYNVDVVVTLSNEPIEVPAVFVTEPLEDAESSDEDDDAGDGDSRPTRSRFEPPVGTTPSELFMQTGLAFDFIKWSSTEGRRIVKHAASRSDPVLPVEPSWKANEWESAAQTLGLGDLPARAQHLPLLDVLLNAKRGARVAWADGRVLIYLPVPTDKFCTLMQLRQGAYKEYVNWNDLVDILEARNLHGICPLPASTKQRSTSRLPC